MILCMILDLLFDYDLICIKIMEKIIFNVNSYIKTLLKQKTSKLILSSNK